MERGFILAADPSCMKEAQRRCLLVAAQERSGRGAPDGRAGYFGSLDLNWLYFQTSTGSIRERAP